jgi:splicing factor U2AF 65 kDa subunit
VLQAVTGATSLVANKKQREVYVGNLTIGVVTDVMLRELFNGALAHLVPDPISNPPVVTASLDPSGACRPCLSSAPSALCRLDAAGSPL